MVFPMRLFSNIVDKDMVWLYFTLSIMLKKIDIGGLRTPHTLMSGRCVIHLLKTAYYDYYYSNQSKCRVLRLGFILRS